MTDNTPNHEAMQVCIPRDWLAARCHSPQPRACAEPPSAAGRPGTGGRAAASSHTPKRSRLSQTLGSPSFTSTNTAPQRFHSSSQQLPASTGSPPAASPGPQRSAARQAVLAPPPHGTHGLLGSPGPPGQRGPGGPGARPYAVAPERGGL